jgi:hypothetical protein
MPVVKHQLDLAYLATMLDKEDCFVEQQQLKYVFPRLPQILKKLARGIVFGDLIAENSFHQIDENREWEKYVTYPEGCSNPINNSAAAIRHVFEVATISVSPDLTWFSYLTINEEAYIQWARKKQMPVPNMWFKVKRSDSATRETTLIVFATACSFFMKTSKKVGNLSARTSDLSNMSKEILEYWEKKTSQKISLSLGLVISRLSYALFFLKSKNRADYEGIEFESVQRLSSGVADFSTEPDNMWLENDHEIDLFLIGGIVELIKQENEKFRYKNKQLRYKELCEELNQFLVNYGVDTKGLSKKTFENKIRSGLKLANKIKFKKMII